MHLIFKLSKKVVSLLETTFQTVDKIGCNFVYSLIRAFSCSYLQPFPIKFVSLFELFSLFFRIRLRVVPVVFTVLPIGFCLGLNLGICRWLLLCSAAEKRAACQNCRNKCYNDFFHNLKISFFFIRHRYK